MFEFRSKIEDRRRNTNDPSAFFPRLWRDYIAPLPSPLRFFVTRVRIIGGDCTIADDRRGTIRFVGGAKDQSVGLMESVKAFSLDYRDTKCPESGIEIE